MRERTPHSCCRREGVEGAVDAGTGLCAARHQAQGSLLQGARGPFLQDRLPKEGSRPETANAWLGETYMAVQIKAFAIAARG